MSVINQALKKAQRERQQVQDGAAWILSAPTGAAVLPRRGQALWVVAAALFALSLGATLHAWLAGPTAYVGNTLKPVRPVADAAPEARPMQPTKNLETSFRAASQAVPPAPRQRPAQPGTAGVRPIRPVEAPAARRPAVPDADYVSRGNRLYRRGDYQGAIDMYQAALAFDPSDVKARNNLGSAYMQLSLDGRASAAFEAVLQLDSTYSLAYYNMACVRGRAGDVDGAADYLRRAMAIEPRARAWARTDSDFALVRDAPVFRRLLEP
jgi:tetratricopeptide (TPR) repeat protein